MEALIAKTAACGCPNDDQTCLGDPKEAFLIVSFAQKIGRNHPSSDQPALEALVHLVGPWV